MKKLLVILPLTILLVNANSMYKKGNKIIISSGSESCAVRLASNNRVKYSSCKILTNSKNIKIFCTKHKKVCKTIYEVAELSGNTTNRNDGYKSFQNCYDNADAGYKLRECINKELDYYTAIINRVYKKAMRTLPKSEKIRLRKSERAWIKHRDLKCDSEAAPMRGGTGERTLFGGCVIEETKKRIKFIKYMIKQNNY
jgi:uncharacterized protein YecT (DUF1311 family)